LSYERTFGSVAPGTGHVGAGHDMMTLMLAGLEFAPHHTRLGLKMGLEKVRNLPSLTGGARAVMGFGPWERSAVKGPDLFIYRTLRDGAAIPFDGPADLQSVLPV
jgi:hypothetical protein